MVELVLDLPSTQWVQAGPWDGSDTGNGCWRGDGNGNKPTADGDETTRQHPMGMGMGMNQQPMGGMNMGMNQGMPMRPPMGMGPGGMPGAGYNQMGAAYGGQQAYGGYR